MAGFSAIQSNLAGELGPERVTNARVSVEFFAHRDASAGFAPRPVKRSLSARFLLRRAPG